MSQKNEFRMSGRTANKCLAAISIFISFYCLSNAFFGLLTGRLFLAAKANARWLLKANSPIFFWILVAMHLGFGLYCLWTVKGFMRPIKPKN